jgi:acyl-CoA synthetase (NDP forming)
MEGLKSIIEGKEGRTVLLEHEVKEILRQAGFSVPAGFFAPKGASWEEILERSAALSFPLVAKVSSSRIVSKTEVGGVKTGIKDIHALRVLRLLLAGVLTINLDLLLCLVLVVYSWRY